MAQITTDIIEGINSQILDWKQYDSTSFNTIYNCDSNNLEGPFLGKVPKNIKKQYLGLNPHYQIFITLDIVYTEYWSNVGNFVEVLLDNQSIMKDINIKSSQFTTPSSYCQNNILNLCAFNQQLKTIKKLVTHFNINPILKIESSFDCLLISLNLCCENLLIKNIVILSLECHFTCLTCTGPNENQCTTCPYGTPINGKCQCQTGTYSYQFQCITSCPQYYIINNNQCILECSKNCLNCQSQICLQCEIGYYKYQNICVQVCPKNSIIDNTNCIDYSELSQQGSEFIGKHFVGFENSIINDLDLFTFSFNSINSKLTGEIFSVYNNQYLLGGFGVWSDGSFSITYTGIQAHNKLRIYMSVWIIDNWNGEYFKISLDGQIIYSKQYFTSEQQSNLFYNSEKDYIDNIELEINHISNNAQFIFQSTLTKSSFEASIAISNIFILIDYCDQNCDICNLLQCQQCQVPYQLINKKCGLCDNSNNRQNDCSCQNGYYDDGINLICKQCNIECETCNNYNTCLECKYGSNLIILPYCMNCNIGYYYLNGSCYKCDINCLSCYGPDQNQCLTCNDNQILNNQNECQNCLENQYKKNETECVHCSYNCLQCLDNKLCLTCKLNRIDPPLCYCEQGYFENENKECSQCNFKCETCELESNNCLSCAANRQIIPNCDCTFENEYDNSIWCTDCKTAVLNIDLISDSTVIQITFSQKINQVYSDCSYLFEYESFILFGLNPTCQINNYSINIILGNNPTIKFGNQIILKSNLIQFSECDLKIDSYKNTQLLQSNQQNPIIHFSQSQINLNICQNNQIEIYAVSFENFGLGKVSLIQWDVLKYQEFDNSITKLIENLNSQLVYQQEDIKFNLTSNYFAKNNSFILQLQYENFLKIKGVSLFILKVVYEQITLNLQYQKTHYLISQPISILSNLITCNLSNDNQYNLNVQINSIQKQITLEQYQQQIIEFLPGEINVGFYDIMFTLFDSKNIQITQQNIFISVIKESPNIQLITESNYIGYKQQFKVTAQFINFDSIQYNKIKWECFLIESNKICPYYNETQLTQSTSNVIYAPYTFEPFQIIQISINYDSFKQSTIITILETDIPKITYETLFNLNTGYINFYDSLRFQFRFTEIYIDPDELIYIGLIQNENKLRKQFKFNYLDLQIQLWDHFSLEELTNNIQLKINIYNPNYFMPSQVTIPLKINIPPLYCYINIESDSQISMKSNFTISISNCIDQNYPLQYKIVYYHNISQYDNDQNKGQLHKGIILSDYSYESKFNTYLAGNGTIYLMIQVKDSLNGISNYSIAQNITLDNSQLISSIDKITSISQLQILAISMLYNNNKTNEQIQEKLYQAIQNLSICNCQNQKYLYQLKTLIHSQFLSEKAELTSEFQLCQNILNTIYQSIKQSFSKDYDSYQHTVLEFSKINLIEETLIIANYLGILFKNNMQTIKSRRILQDDEQNIINQNNMLLIDSVSKIGEIQLQEQIINSKQLEINTETFNVTTKKISNQQFSQLINNNSLQNQNNVSDHSQNQSYSYKMTQFYLNPYLYDNKFEYSQNDVQFPLQNLEILSLQNKTQIQNLSDNTIQLEFDNDQNNSLNLQCVSKIEDRWSLDACKTIKDNNKIVCQCQYISSTTIIEAVEQIANLAVQFFTLQTMEQILNCSYQTILFTYIVILYTIIFVWFLFYGNNLDNMKSKEYQTKVFPIDWDYVCEKSKGIEQIGSIDSTKRLPSVTRLNLRKEISQKSIFSQSDYTSYEKSLGKKQEFNSQRNLVKMSSGVTTNVLSGRIVEETQIDDQDKNTAQSPNVKIENVQNERNIDKKQHLYLQLCLEQISFMKGLLFYIEISHKILSLYYLYDKDYSRNYRTIVLYVSLLGEIAILTFFGEIINLNTIIALSLLQTVFGTIYRRLLSYFLSSQKSCFNYIGFNMAILSVLLFLFVILGSLAKYKNPIEGAMWGAAYLGSFILEYLIYSNIQFLFFFIIINKYGSEIKIKQLLKYLLNDKVYIEIFGDEQK